jgi:hypothetical protein
MKCKCGLELIFNDNSISQLGNKDVIPLYYCSNCNIIWDGKNLDNDKWPMFIKVNTEEHKLWFTKEAFLKIKKFYFEQLKEKILYLDGVIEVLKSWET